MKVTIDLNQILMSFNGEPMTEETSDGTQAFKLGAIIARSLGNTYQNDKRDDLEKEKDWLLAREIGRSIEDGVYGSVEFNEQQIMHIKELVVKVFPAPTFGSQARMMIAGEVDEAKKKE